MQLTTDKNTRKQQPIARGFMDYFPNAIAEVAHVSYVGNQQHNPGQPLHWARGKSDDHADCLVRHLIERGTIDDDGLRHSAKAAWRAMALLQLELEAAEPSNPKQDVIEEESVSVPPAVPPSPSAPSKGDCGRHDQVALMLLEIGCPAPIARKIVEGISFPDDKTLGLPDYGTWVYIAGPMRGYKDFNFARFDLARDHLLAKGFYVINPADMSRGESMTRDPHKEDSDKQAEYALRDIFSLIFIRSRESKPDEAAYQKDTPIKGSIALLDGWHDSTGATAEFFVARWLGLRVLDKRGEPKFVTTLTHFRKRLPWTAHQEYIYAHD